MLLKIIGFLCLLKKLLKWPCVVYTIYDSNGLYDDAVSTILLSNVDRIDNSEVVFWRDETEDSSWNYLTSS